MTTVDLTDPEPPVANGTRAERPCEECGDLYRPARRDQRFCSQDCRKLFYARASREASAYDQSPPEAPPAKPSAGSGGSPTPARPVPPGGHDVAPWLEAVLAFCRTQPIREVVVLALDGTELTLRAGPT